jgi:RimJ/RimL family protein N-acetyltransferase
MQIREATAEEERAFFGRNDPAVRDLRCAVVDGTVVAMSGLMRDPVYYGSLFEEDGRWIGFLSLAPGAKPLGWAAVVAMRHFMQTQTEPIVVQHDDRHPKAERLLKALGFRPTDEFKPHFLEKHRKLRTWLWQRSPQ